MQIPEDDSLLDLLRLDALLLSDEAEGFVFLATHAAALPADKYNQVPLEQRTQLQHLLEQFRASVFKECEFPPFPPKREVEFQIQLEPGAQIPSSPVHKLSPALVEQLRSMLQELLHNGLIVPTS